MDPKATIEMTKLMANVLLAVADATRHRDGELSLMDVGDVQEAMGPRDGGATYLETHVALQALTDAGLLESTGTMWRLRWPSKAT